MAVDSSMGEAVASVAEQAIARISSGPVRGGFEIGFLAEDGTDCRVVLEQAWRCRFESCQSVRQFPQYKGQRHFPGRWWTATTGCHVGYESWLERDHLMLLDFDPAVVAVASQPFWLFWTTEQREARSHMPDYFARLVDGSAVVIDCRPAERIRPRDAVAFAATRHACDRLGWDYRVAGATDAVLTRNVRWLAGYRHPRYRVPVVTETLQQVFARPTALMAGGEAIGDPIAVLPTLFHLLWHRELLADLSTPLHPDTEVRVVAGAVPA
jgi:hypothetical protein